MNILQNLKYGSVIFILCLLMIGAYELILYSIAHSFFPEQAEGSFIYDKDGQKRGSVLLVQDFTGEKYFKGRIHLRFDSKCDVALYNDVFRKAINLRYKQRPDSFDVSMFTPSSSLKDPYITRREAILQAKGISKARNIDLATLMLLIDRVALLRSWPFFELDIVNVTKLNLELDDFTLKSESIDKAK